MYNIAHKSSVMSGSQGNYHGLIVEVTVVGVKPPAPKGE